MTELWYWIGWDGADGLAARTALQTITMERPYHFCTSRSHRATVVHMGVAAPLLCIWELQPNLGFFGPSSSPPAPALLTSDPNSYQTTRGKHSGIYLN